jgi:hypothetical protein
MIYRFAYEVINIKKTTMGKKKGKKEKNPYQLMVDHVIASGPIDFEYIPVIEDN